jgi:Kef-type K+ transport system membrane component KefB
LGDTRRTGPTDAANVARHSADAPSFGRQSAREAGGRSACGSIGAVQGPLQQIAYQLASQMITFLLQALLVLLLPLLLWLPARNLVPLVLMQILCGILLGPTALGGISAQTYQWLFPAASVHAFSGLSSLAVVFVAALAGMHMDPDGAGRRGDRPVLAISVFAFIGPAIVGGLFAMAAAVAEPSLIGPKGASGMFFPIGALCFGVTALPVLVSILRELGFMETPLGQTALAAAASNDLLLWSLMALFLGTLSPSHSSLFDAVFSLIGLLAFAAAVWSMRLALRYLASTLGPGQTLSHLQMSLVLCGVFGCACLAEAMNLHAAIGAFAAGMVIPRRLVAQVTALLGPTTHTLLLPFFFVTAGLRVDLEHPMWWFVIGSVAIGSLSKIVCTAVPARACGWSWNEAMQLGALMQSRGLMELLVLSVFFDAGLISSGCYSSLVIMALATTALTLPSVRLLVLRRAGNRAAQVNRPGVPEASGI